MFQQNARPGWGSDTAEPDAQAGQTAKRRFEALKVLATVDDIAGRLDSIPYPARANVEFLLLDIRTQLQADHPDPAKLRATLMAVQRLLSTSQASRGRWAEQLAERPAPLSGPEGSHPPASRPGRGWQAGLLVCAGVMAGGWMLLPGEGVEAVRTMLSPAPTQPLPPRTLPAESPPALPVPSAESGSISPAPETEAGADEPRPAARLPAAAPVAPEPAGERGAPAAEARVEPRRVEGPVIARIAMKQAGNLRTEPRNQSQVLRTLPRGTPLSVFREALGGWYQVGADQPWGWVHSSLTDRPR
ncbi:SH3 domain-containing protein [Roseomonas gilardii]|uniref:SH3 domain-containing protein n=1 Tax=Roseomonas gilardii TaxID=257708 RepID=UPI0021B6B796|nr:SH3 domain-containing protein [Roseomonas gilardii]